MAAAAARIFSRVAWLTPGLPLSATETDAVEIPSFSAMSLAVIFATVRTSFVFSIVIYPPPERKARRQ